jgi:hypothetical protein
MKRLIKLAIVFLSSVIILIGCASEEAVVKKDDKAPQVKLSPNKTLSGVPVVPKQEIIKETREVLHFYTFKTEPMGAGVYVVDTQTGKEVGFLGTTPVRILALKNKVEVEGFHLNCTGLFPNVAGLTLANKSGSKIEQVEFQFKFKLQGYYDEMKIERLPINSVDNTDTICSATLSMVGGQVRK